MSGKLEDLGRAVSQKRGSRGLREVAREIGISHATLSRVEHGHFPDLANFEKIRTWLGASNSQPLMEMSKQAAAHSVPQVHFRKKPTISADTARALAQLILAAQAAMLPQDESL